MKGQTAKIFPFFCLRNSFAAEKSRGLFKVQSQWTPMHEQLNVRKKEHDNARLKAEAMPCCERKRPITVKKTPFSHEHHHHHHHHHDTSLFVLFLSTLSFLMSRWFDCCIVLLGRSLPSQTNEFVPTRASLFLLIIIVACGLLPSRSLTPL